MFNCIQPHPFGFAMIRHSPNTSLKFCFPVLVFVVLPLSRLVLLAVLVPVVALCIPSKTTCASSLVRAEELRVWGQNIFYGCKSEPLPYVLTYLASKQLETNASKTLGLLCNGLWIQTTPTFALWRVAFWESQMIHLSPHPSLFFADSKNTLQN
jgi:hypothetical protein